ncbi:hypothetical protein X777_04642 [Ooceraea biroi]|uniref:Uncharacterized protein n=1 Tax=Ooceraea biroi TaxID=2015173 RepID=A0A026X1D8_OOCBI|nr:hypothetical protein X777_04642 [Ooceraea biroi]
MNDRGDSGGSGEGKGRARKSGMKKAVYSSAEASDKFVHVGASAREMPTRMPEGSSRAPSGENIDSISFFPRGSLSTPPSLYSANDQVLDSQNHLSAATRARACRPSSAADGSEGMRVYSRRQYRDTLCLVTYYFKKFHLRNFSNY